MFQVKSDASEDSNNASANMRFNRLNKRIRIKARKSGTKLYPVPIITLEIRGEDPELIANFANRVGREAERVAAEEVVSDLRAVISVKINNLKMKIDALREQAKKKRLDEIELLTINDALETEKLNSTIAALREHAKKERLYRITRLKEAADIAHKLGIKDSIAHQLNKINEKSSSETGLLTGVTAETELYKRGYEALEAEIESLLKRDNDDPYIADLGKLQSELLLLKNNPKIERLRNRKSDDLYIQSLREIEKEIRLLESIKIDKAMFKTAHIDRAAFPPKQHIKPKQILIIVLGVVLGIVLGIYSAFMFREFNKL
jgi:LPS O-antigen subunit length determinant protein (WzzB/FepE family)